MKLLVTAAAVIFGATSCGGDDDSGSSCGLVANCDGTLETYAPGLIVAGDMGNLSVRVVSVTPDPPEAEQSSWLIQIVDGAGDLVDDATLTSANSWSLDCGHFGLEGGTGIDLTDNGDAGYAFDADYVHGGPWEMRLEVEAGGVTDRVDVGFCLPETAPHAHGANPDDDDDGHDDGHDHE